MKPEAVLYSIKVNNDDSLETDTIRLREMLGYGNNPIRKDLDHALLGRHSSGDIPTVVFAECK